MKKQTILIFLLLGANFLLSQINYSAHDVIPEYTGDFHYGSNLGNYPPWTNAEVGNIAAGNEDLDIEGIGVQNFRVSMQEHFVETWGYDIRKDDFEHWENIGMSNHLMMLGWPSEEHRDPFFYCPMVQSELFENMYEPIWDEGIDGTPINENNYYANYVYKVVSEYQDYITFYEVWNEPDFSLSPNAWLGEGQPGNWWENNPDPCDMKIGAPIFHYIRLLRIAYEVIHTVDPTAYVCTGGIGNPAFLDAILRNTDNPIDGSVTVDYPLKGGAWFDVLSYHSYPHFDGSMWEFPATGGLFYYRHSDRGVEGMLDRKDAFQEVLDYHNYGDDFPEKLWVLSETMLPREQFNNYIGSHEAQRNYLLKAFVEARRNDILQVDLFSFAEIETETNNWNEYFYMGLFENLSEVSIYDQNPTSAGVSFKTINTILESGAEYDETKTNQLNLPTGVKGAAFEDNGEFIFVLWAETSIDQSEEANAMYSFPASFGFEEVEIKEWDYSETNTFEIQSPQNIALTGTPIFIREAPEGGVAPTSSFSQNIDKQCVPFIVNFEDNSVGEPTEWNWSFEGGTIASSTEQNPSVTFFEPGVFGVTLTVSNAFGENTTTVAEAVIAEDIPDTDFEFLDEEFTVTFTNLSENANTYNWNFGDTNVSQEENPIHEYAANGIYDVTLTTSNNCGNHAFAQEVIIQTLSADDIEGISSISVFPNPNAGKFMLKIESEISDELEIVLTDLAGKEILKNIEKINFGIFQKQFEINHLGSGLYLLQLKINGQTGFLKIIVE